MSIPAPPLCSLVLVEDEEGHILASSRRYNPRRLNLPGGKIDEEDVTGHPDHGRYYNIDNTLLNCAIRELREETGLHVELEDLVLLYTGVCTHNPIEDEEQEPDSICFTYLATKWSGTPKQPDGEPPIRWVTWEDLIKSTPYPEYNTQVLFAVSRWENTSSD